MARNPYTFDPAHPDARAASEVQGALYGSPLVQYITQSAHKYGLDPRVALAVAPHEGGFEGAIGDQGTSFGPFQLHAGGALPSSVWAQGSEYARQWANSPEGLDYALRSGSKAIGGATGPAGVASWVTNFERPASQYVQGEVAKALSTYGAPAGSYAPSNSTPTPHAATNVEPMAAPMAPVAPSPQQQAASQVSGLASSLAQQLTGAAQSMLQGGSPNLSSLFAAAKGYQQARASFTRASPLGGTGLQMKAGGLKA